MFSRIFSRGSTSEGHNKGKGHRNGSTPEPSPRAIPVATDDQGVVADSRPAGAQEEGAAAATANVDDREVGRWISGACDLNNRCVFELPFFWMAGIVGVTDSISWQICSSLVEWEGAVNFGGESFDHCAGFWFGDFRGI